MAEILNKLTEIKQHVLGCFTFFNCGYENVRQLLDDVKGNDPTGNREYQHVIFDDRLGNYFWIEKVSDVSLSRQNNGIMGKCEGAYHEATQRFSIFAMAKGIGEESLFQCLAGCLANYGCKLTLTGGEYDSIAVLRRSLSTFTKEDLNIITSKLKDWTIVRIDFSLKYDILPTNYHFEGCDCEPCEDVACDDCSIDVTGLQWLNDALYIQYTIQTDCEDGCLCTEIWLHDPNVEDIINTDFIGVTVDGTTYNAPVPIDYTNEAAIRAFLFGLNLPVNWIVHWYYDSAPDDWTYIFGVSCQSHIIEIEMEGGTFTLNSFQNVAIPILYSIYQYYNFEWIGDPYTFVCYNNACDCGLNTISVGLSITSNGDTTELDCQQSTGIYDVKEQSAFIDEDGAVAVIGASNNGCVSFCDTATFITIVDSGVVNRSGGDTILPAPASVPVCGGVIGFVELLSDGVIGVTLNATTGAITVPAQVLGVDASYYYYVTCDGLVVATIRYTLINL